MARCQTMVQLTEELVALLDAEAARRGQSRSALIRSVLEDFLAADREAAIGRAIVEGYRRVPPGIPDGWGDLEDMTERANRDLMRRLATEESSRGMGPWKGGPQRGRSR